MTPADLLHRLPAQLLPDPTRVIAKLFLPGEEANVRASRAGAIVARVLALPEPEIESLAHDLEADFSARHRNYADVMAEHTRTIGAHLRSSLPISEARRLVLGATFTAEYAVEAAALCNPSAVPHPDQSGLAEGQLRVTVSLRGIGEGHVSSIGFVTATIGPGARWQFEPRTLPAVVGVHRPGRWGREHLRAVLVDHGRLDELARSLLGALPETFTGADLQHAIVDAPYDLLHRPGAPDTVALLRRLIASAYVVDFPAGTDISQQVLLPHAAEESNGMEDARFVRFVGADGTIDYRATYTAYDGHQIAPRLLVSPDLRSFRAQRLAGEAARNKGMALFPRLIDGRHWALCRSDGESTSVTSSADGVIWHTGSHLEGPGGAWKILQVGNCGPPIETGHGWLVLTHGVGPMRSYAIGALLLDLADPTRVIAHLAQPMLTASPAERDGYVPNVVYSCGGVVHDGALWLPYGIGDVRIGVARGAVDDIVESMTFV